MRSGLARLAAEIKMRRTQHDGAFLVVEGKTICVPGGHAVTKAADWSTSAASAM